MNDRLWTVTQGVITAAICLLLGGVFGFFYGRDFERNQNKNAIDIRVPGVQFQYK